MRRSQPIKTEAERLAEVQAEIVGLPKADADEILARLEAERAERQRIETELQRKYDRGLA